MKSTTYSSKAKLSRRNTKKNALRRTAAGTTTTSTSHIIVIVGCGIFVLMLFAAVAQYCFIAVSVFHVGGDESSTLDGSANNKEKALDKLRGSFNLSTDDKIESSMTSNSEYLMLISEIGAIQIKPYYYRPSSLSSSSIQSSSSSTSFQQKLKLLREGRQCQKCQFYGINVKNQQLFGSMTMVTDEPIASDTSEYHGDFNMNSKSLKRGMVARVNKDGSDFVINVGGSDPSTSVIAQPVHDEGIIMKNNRQQQQDNNDIWGIVEDESSLELISNIITSSYVLLDDEDHQGIIHILREPVNFEMMII